MTLVAQLGARLSALSDDALDALVRDREVPQRSQSMLDIAEWLLSDAAVRSALAITDPHEVALLAAGSASQRSISRALGDDGGAFDAVRDAAQQLRSQPAAVQEHPEHLIEIATERASTETLRVVGLVEIALTHPIPTIGRGQPSAAAARTVSTELGIAPDALAPLATLAMLARLVWPSDGELRATDAGLAWLAKPLPLAWEQLSAAFVTSLTLAERGALQHASTSVATDYPHATVVQRERLEAVLSQARLLGLVVGGETVLIGTDDSIGPESRALVAKHAPAPIAMAYVQPDLTIIAPGPLQPAVRQRLGRLAVAERRGMASSYRVERASIDRALAGGETAESLRAFLSDLSPTPLPQPLEYVIREAADRAGALAIRPAEAGTRILTDRSTMELLLHDRSLAALQLRETVSDDARYEVAATSGASPDTVAALLQAARLRPTLQHADGTPLAQTPALTVPPPAQGHTPLVARLRDTGFDVADAERTWLERTISKAVRAKMPLRVTVESAGEEHTLNLVPLGLANGRLRARDTDRDLERTLPMRAVVRISGTPAE